MAKPSLVTLPFALLLLDVWPLARQRPFARLVLEKAPLFALSALSSLLTVDYQRQVLLTTDEVSPAQRAANAVGRHRPLSRQARRGRAIWRRSIRIPISRRKAVLRSTPASDRWPPPRSASGSRSWCCARADSAYLAVGWLWFLGMLAADDRNRACGAPGPRRPLQLPADDRPRRRDRLGRRGRSSHACAPPALRRRCCSRRRPARSPASASLAFAQARTWRDSETVFRHDARREPPRERDPARTSAAGCARIADSTRRSSSTAAGLEVDPEQRDCCISISGARCTRQGRVAEAIEEYRASGGARAQRNRARAVSARCHLRDGRTPGRGRRAVSTRRRDRPREPEAARAARGR